MGDLCLTVVNTAAQWVLWITKPPLRNGPINLTTGQSLIAAYEPDVFGKLQNSPE
jgi:hypothetical protein